MSNNLELTKELLSKLEDKGFIDNIEWQSTELALYHLTTAVQMIFGSIEEYTDKEWAVVQKAKMDAMVDFWCDYLGVELLPTFDPTPFISDYYSLSGEADIFIINGELSDYEKLGYRGIDIELYCAAVRLDFDRTRRLLDNGADPNVQFKVIGTDDELWNVLWHIGGEMSWLSTEFAFLEDDNSECRYIEIDKFISYAAHAEMYRLLEKHQNVSQ